MASSCASTDHAAKAIGEKRYGVARRHDASGQKRDANLTARVPKIAEASVDGGTSAEQSVSSVNEGELFPPVNFAPPHERSARTGDGIWSPLGDRAAEERAAMEPRAVYKTVVHPHPVNHFWSVTVAAMSLRHVRLHWLAGTTDPKAPSDVPAEDRSGLVPESDRATLLAIFNGGFQSQHGHWGMMLHGHTFVAARKDGCTVAIYYKGAVRIRSWPVLARDESKDVAAFRQTPPCLVEQGSLNASLLAGNDRAWAGDTRDVKTRRRSAIGVDASGQILFYGLGEEVDARYLAEGMKAAGAIDAAELDINWNWTRFLLVAQADGALEFTSTLVPQMPHGQHEYLTRPTTRDFFYVTRR